MVNLVNKIPSCQLTQWKASNGDFSVLWGGSGGGAGRPTSTVHSRWFDPSCLNVKTLNTDSYQ